MITNPDVLLQRSRFIHAIRKYFTGKNILEVDTPFLKKVPGMEPYLDPFRVMAGSEVQGYLITSPEYSLKQTLAVLKESNIPGIYELAHAFRSGEKGTLHTAEFLMLEFYLRNRDESGLVETCIELFDFLNHETGSKTFSGAGSQVVAMHDLFIEKTGRGFSREELLLTVAENRLPASANDRFDDLFFIVFLNLIEPSFTGGPYFVTGWPAELAALARVENGIARRVEIYWKGVEIGNGFYELNDPVEQRVRFGEEQSLRKKLGKEVFALDEEFLESLGNMPEASGISLGIDRLFMIYSGYDNLRQVSPYTGGGL